MKYRRYHVRNVNIWVGENLVVNGFMLPYGSSPLCKHSVTILAEETELKNVKLALEAKLIKFHKQGES